MGGGEPLGQGVFRGRVHDQTVNAPVYQFRIDVLDGLSAIDAVQQQVFAILDAPFLNAADDLG
jgi:hypothetical protein